MKLRTSLALVLALFASWASAKTASAQEPQLHHVRAGLNLGVAAEGTKLIYATLAAKIFDVGLARALVDEVERSVQEGKKSSDRAQALLSESQSGLEAEYEKLRTAIKRAEDQTVKLKQLITQETQGLEAEDQEGGALDAREGGEASSAQPRWSVMKDETAWLYFDVIEALALHKKLGGKVKAPGLSAPSKPKTKRE